MVEDASALTSYVFFLKGSTGAHIGLNEGSAPFFEIVIGGWSNSRSVIRTEKLGTDLVEHNEPLLDSNAFRQFWVSWINGVLKVGKFYQYPLSCYGSSLNPRMQLDCCELNIT